MQRAVSCVTEAVLGGRIYEAIDVPGVMAFARRENGRLIEAPVPIGRGPHLLLSLRHIYQFRHVPEDAERGPWTVTSLAHSYELLDMNERRVIAYHWHPDTSLAFEPVHVGRQFAHSSLPADVRTHAAALVRAHLPTGRISLESVIRLAIRELGVEPIKREWEAILNETEEAFKRDRTP